MCGGEVQKWGRRVGMWLLSDGRKLWKARENVLGLGDSQCKGPEKGVCQDGKEACIGQKRSEKAWVAIARPATLTQSEEEHEVEHHLPCCCAENKHGSGQKQEGQRGGCYMSPDKI